MTQNRYYALRMNNHYKLWAALWKKTKQSHLRNELWTWRELGLEYLVQAAFNDRLSLLNEKWSLALTTFSLLNTLNVRWDEAAFLWHALPMLTTALGNSHYHPQLSSARSERARRLTNRGRVKTECHTLPGSLSKWHSMLLKPRHILTQTKATLT